LEGGGPGLNKSVCGYLLTGKTITSFKGGTKQFQFFVPTNSGYEGPNQDYFVIAFSHHALSDDQNIAMLQLSDAQMSRAVLWIDCELANANYVPARYQTLWVFDSGAQKRWGGGEWLRASAGRDGLFCGYNASEVYPRRAEIKSWTSSGGAKRYFVRWSDIERQVLAFTQNTAHGDFGMCARARPIPGFQE